MNSKGTAITDMDLSKISDPTLLVAKTDDECQKTPAEGADKIAALLVNAGRAEVKKFQWGKRPCI